MAVKENLQTHIHTRFLEFPLIVGKSAVNLANPNICRLNSHTGHTGSWNVFHSEVLKDSADVLDQVVVFVLLAPFHRTFNENLGLDKSTGDGFEGGRGKNNWSAFCICLPMSRKNMIFLGPYWALGDMQELGFKWPRGFGRFPNLWAPQLKCFTKAHLWWDWEVQAWVVDDPWCGKPNH